jgi:DNA-binding transcriptional LysR family regulator
MDINYELYKVFYYVATSLSFSEASKQLFISQSAVSQSIKTLEKKLDQPLFIRSTKKVQLTPAGKVLLKHIEPAMNLIQRGESQLLDSGSLGLGQLHIGASDTICRYFLVPYLKQFHKKFPNVPIKVTNATSLSCVDLLDQGKVDLIVTNFPNSNLNHSYIQKTVCNFTDVFIANPAYFNLKQQEIPFEELKQYPILMLDRKSTTSQFLHQIVQFNAEGNVQLPLCAPYLVCRLSDKPQIVLYKGVFCPFVTALRRNTELLVSYLVHHLPAAPSSASAPARLC